MHLAFEMLYMVSICLHGSNPSCHAYSIGGLFQITWNVERGREIVYQQITYFFLPLPSPCPCHQCHPLALSLTGFSYLCLDSDFPGTLINMQSTWNADSVILQPNATNSSSPGPLCLLLRRLIKSRKHSLSPSWPLYPSPIFISRK